MMLRIGATIFLLLITALWARGIYRHFIHPPEEAGFDWGMVHGLRLTILTAVVLGMWAAWGGMILSTVTDLLDRVGI